MCSAKPFVNTQHRTPSTLVRTQKVLNLQFYVLQRLMLSGSRTVVGDVLADVVIYTGTQYSSILTWDPLAPAVEQRLR